MCRLFGLIANKEVDIKFSMLEASKRFKDQGEKNPHGWGIGWYENGVSKIEKDDGKSSQSETFDYLSKMVRSNIFISHVRYATYGKVMKENSHPFLYRNWIFAHNGSVDYMEIMKKLDERYKDFTSNLVDSEVYFRYLIQSIEKEKDIVSGIIEGIKKIVGNFTAGANFIMSDGVRLYVFRYNNPLHFIVRDPSTPLHCKSKETHALIESKRLAGEKAFLVSTERLTDESWIEVNNGELLVIDKGLNIESYYLE